MLHYLRLWDTRTANGVDHFVANSHFIAGRIRRVYGRLAQVIYPPVDVETFGLCEAKDDFYLAASRMVPYKRMDLIVRAFARMPDKRLVVIGDGPDFHKVRKLAAPNVELLGYQPLAVLRKHMQRAKAFVFAAEEDFGIAPVEAQACGTPVIAYGKGGALETIIGLDGEQPTGMFYDSQTPDGLCAAIEHFQRSAHRIVPARCRSNAERFSTNRFRREFTACVDEQVGLWKSRLVHQQWMGQGKA
jgi:glycosyltransferase involved in cell wall biosynthesis